MRKYIRFEQIEDIIRFKQIEIIIVMLWSLIVVLSVQIGWGGVYWVCIAGVFFFLLYRFTESNWFLQTMSENTLSQYTSKASVLFHHLEESVALEFTPNEFPFSFSCDAYYYRLYNRFVSIKLYIFVKSSYITSCLPVCINVRFVCLLASGDWLLGRPVSWRGVTWLAVGVMRLHKTKSSPPLSRKDVSVPQSACNLRPQLFTRCFPTRPHV